MRGRSSVDVDVDVVLTSRGFGSWRLARLGTPHELFTRRTRLDAIGFARFIIQTNASAKKLLQRTINHVLYAKVRVLTPVRHDTEMSIELILVFCGL